MKAGTEIIYRHAGKEFTYLVTNPTEFSHLGNAHILGRRWMKAKACWAKTETKIMVCLIK